MKIHLSSPNSLRSLTLSTLALTCSFACAATPFTIAVIGDQQRPVDSLSIYPSFTVQTDWLAANAQAENLRFVTQVGDILEHGGDLAEFNRAEAAMATLDTATNADGGTGVPWNVNYGNHEQDSSQAGSDPAGAWAHNYRQYFGSASGTHRYAGQPEYGGVSSNDLNTWHIIKSSNALDAREYLMLNLEYDAPGHAPGSTPDPADVPAFDAIAWAWEILEQHPGLPTIVTTHVFEGSGFGPPNSPYTSGPGRNSQLQIFDKLVKDNPQIFMVLSGHTSQDSHQVKTNTAGLKVLQMVTDYNKVRPNGGDGFFRLVELDEDAGEINVKTYTPGVPQDPTPRFDTSANGQFTVTIDWATRFPTPSGPIMGAPSIDNVTDDGSTIESRLTNEDVTDVTLVWAYTDQGETDVATWTGAPGGGSHSFGSAVAGEVLSRVVTGLDGDTTYVVRFLGTGAVESDWSSAASFNTGLGGEPAPTNFAGVTGVIAGGTKVDLSWTDGFTTETGFLIQRSTDAGFATFDEFTISADETSYTDETTDANATYFYRIAAVSSTGTGAFTANLEVATGDAGAGPVAGLIAHWKFDEGTGTTAADSSGNGLTATTTGATTWDTGVSGNAAINPKFTLSDSSSLALADGNTAFTVSLWAKTTTNDDFANLAGFEGTGSTGDRYSLKVSGGNTQVTPGGATASGQIATLSSGSWVHIVAINDPTAGASYVYIDGTQSGVAGTVVNLGSTTSEWTMGTYWNSGSYDYTGALDDVQVYNQALSSSDVGFLYNNPGSPLLAEGSGLVMGPPSSTNPGDDGATLECQLLNADADAVTLVWALADQGESDISTWTSASGGGSHSFGATTADDVLSHAVTGLTGDTEYFFRFLATAGGDSDWSDAASFTTGLGGAGALTGLAATPGTTATTTKVDLTWTDSYSTETGFVIQRTTDSGFSSYDEFSVGANEVGFTDDTTAANTTYFYRVAAVGSSGAGTLSSSIEVTTGDVPSVAPVVTRGPYLQAAAHDRMTLRWRSDIVGIGVVRYGTTPGSLDQSASPGTAETEHVVPITGLAPNTVYYYAIETQNGSAITTAGADADHFFTTHPTPGSSDPTRVWVIGDSGTTSTAKQDVYDAYRNRGEDTDVWLMLGDNAYNSGTDNEFQAAVFDSYPELLRNTPLWSCIGNHEAYTSGGQPYLDLHTFPTAGESGGVASGTERYYSFDRGNIHFVCIDSETSGNYNDVPGSGGMVDWLELDLQATDKDWIIAYMHHGPYTKGSHDSDSESHHIVIRRYVVPLLEQYGVDLVLSGHSHCYERSMLINGHHSAMSTADSTSGTFDPLTHIVDGGNGSTVGTVDGTGSFVVDGGDGVYEKLPPSDKVGTVYSTCGASGKLSAWDNGSTAVVNPAPHPVFIVNLRVMGSMIIDVDGETLNARYIDGSSTVRDDFTIRKIGAGLFLSAASATAVADDGATVESQLYNVDADDVTAVWAYADQGESTVVDWTNAPGGGSYSFGATSQDTVLSHVLTGLNGDTAYSVRFFATAGGDSIWSAAGSFATGLGGSSAPTGLAAVSGTTATSTKVDLTWIDSFTNETGFLIQRSTDPGFASFDEFSLAANLEEYTDDTTSANTTYHYRIAGAGASGTGIFSAGVQITTGDDPGGTPVASLIAHWTFDEGSGTTAADSSGNALTATGANNWTTGVSGSAANNPKFTLSDSSSLAFVGQTAYTVSLWAKTTTNDDFAILAGFEGTGSSGDRYGLKVSGGTIQLTQGNGPKISSPGQIATYSGGNWVHIVGVNDPTGGASYLYVNGVEVADGGVVNIPSSSAAEWTMGTYYNSGGYDYTGALDDVQVYDQALTATDVAFLYNNPGSPLSSAAAPPFEGWATTNITDIDPSADATFGGNPDGDPFANGLEWALGGNPLGFDSLDDLLGHAGDATTGLTLTFTREDASEGELDLAVEFSNDLFDADVHVSPIPAASGTVGGVSYTINENGSAPDDITATIPAGNAAGGKLFGRIRVTEN